MIFLFSFKTYPKINNWECSSLKKGDLSWVTEQSEWQIHCCHVQAQGKHKSKEKHLKHAQTKWKTSESNCSGLWEILA